MEAVWKAVLAPRCLVFRHTECFSGELAMDVSRTLPHRVLDPSEADGTLPAVRTLLARIRRRVALRERLHGEMLVLQMLSECCPDGTPDFQEFVEKSVRYHRLGGQVDALVERLGQLGCVVRNRDPEWGDFTFLRKDGLALLCWHVDEERVLHWHFMHESHSDRRPLTTTNA